MTRINVELSEELHKQLKVAAALKEEAIKMLIIELLSKKVEIEMKNKGIKIK